MSRRSLGTPSGCSPQCKENTKNAIPSSSGLHLPDKDGEDQENSDNLSHGEASASDDNLTNHLVDNVINHLVTKKVTSHLVTKKVTIVSPNSENTPSSDHSNKSQRKTITLSSHHLSRASECTPKTMANNSPLFSRGNLSKGKRRMLLQCDNLEAPSEELIMPCTPPISENPSSLYDNFCKDKNPHSFKGATRIDELVRKNINSQKSNNCKNKCEAKTSAEAKHSDVRPQTSRVGNDSYEDFVLERNSNRRKTTGSLKRKSEITSVNSNVTPTTKYRDSPKAICSTIKSSSVTKKFPSTKKSPKVPSGKKKSCKESILVAEEAPSICLTSFHTK